MKNYWKLFMISNVSNKGIIGNIWSVSNKMYQIYHFSFLIIKNKVVLWLISVENYENQRQNINKKHIWQGWTAGCSIKYISLVNHYFRHIF